MRMMIFLETAPLPHRADFFIFGSSGMKWYAGVNRTSAEEVFIPNAMTSGATGLPLSVCAKGGKEMLHKAVSRLFFSFEIALHSLPATSWHAR